MSVGSEVIESGVLYCEVQLNGIVKVTSESPANIP
jgi:hypothetical protein